MPDPTKPVQVILKDVTANVDAQSCATSPVQSQVRTNRPIFVLILQFLVGHVAALLTLKANNWFDTLPMKQQEIMINNVVLLSSATNEETPYEQLLHY